MDQRFIGAGGRDAPRDADGERAAVARRLRDDMHAAVTTLRSALPKAFAENRDGAGRETDGSAARNRRRDALGADPADRPARRTGP